MPTNIAGTVARHPYTQQVVYLRVTMRYTDYGDFVSMGYIPADAIIVDAGVCVEEPFNAFLANTIDIGTRGDSAGIANAMDVSTVGVKRGDDLPTYEFSVLTQDTEIITTYLQAGDDQSAGAAEVFIGYLIQ